MPNVHALGGELLRIYAVQNINGRCCDLASDTSEITESQLRSLYVDQAAQCIIWCYCMWPFLPACLPACLRLQEGAEKCTAERQLACI